jgi:hypothetical protein
VAMISVFAVSGKIASAFTPSVLHKQGIHRSIVALSAGKQGNADKQGGK